MTFKVIDRRTLNAAIEEEEREEQERLEKENEDPLVKMKREDGVAEELVGLERRRIELPYEARKRFYETGYAHGIEGRPPQNQDPDYLEGWLEGHQRANRVGTGAPIVVPPKVR